MKKLSKIEFKGIGIVSWIVFLSALVVVLITLTSVLFPAFILGSLSGIKYPIKIDIFEPGIWTYYLLITNFIILTLGIAYWKNFLPRILKKSIRFIFNFEISKKIALVSLLSLLAIYIGLSLDEMYIDDPWIDFNRYVKGALERWSPPTNLSDWISANDPPVTHGLGVMSMEIFGTYNAIPFIASIAIVVLTYLITVEIAKKRFAGIVSVVILLQSGIFTIYDTTITYPNFYVVFFLISLYTVYKVWPLSPISYLVSIPAKALSVVFFPINLFFVYRADIPKRRRILLLITYCTIALIGLAIIFSGQSGTIQNSLKGNFDTRDFWSGFTAFSFEFRFDGLIVLFLLPLTIGLFLVSRAGIKTADAILVMIFWMLLWSAVMPALSNFTNNPYRFVPFVVFFAIGVGTLLSNRKLSQISRSTVQ